jgi:hypothetical protein
MSSLLVGVGISDRAAPGDDPVADAATAEAIDYDFVSAAGNPVRTYPAYETQTLLTWVAARTTRIGIVPRVLGGAVPPARPGRQGLARYVTHQQDAAAPTAAPGRTLPMPATTNSTHPCDRLGAQAYARILLRSHQDLPFCAHHHREHTPALAEAAAAIQDETQPLARADVIRPGGHRHAGTPRPLGQWC